MITTLSLKKIHPWTIPVMLKLSLLFQAKHVIEDRFLGQKVQVIKELEDHVQRLSNMADDEFSLGLFIYDKHL